jgi:DNA (cytosine-5)-methyltransferase 1
VIRPQFTLDLHGELIVDNFAGGGGASTGIELALGRHVDHAINHDPMALGMHRINHPQTLHHCEDVFDIDPCTVCEGRRVGLAHFSPDCKHFSKAKGGQPLDKRIRGLVLVMLRWAKYGARVMTMENVEEIVTWGPLVRIFRSGKWDWYPDPANKGRTWLAFLDCLSTGIDPNHPDLPEILEVLHGTVTKEELVRGFGYQYEARTIRACDHGTPTIRKRLYMVARRDGRPIVFPVATHANQEGNARGLKPWRAIAECIQWDLPCPSIFLNKEEARLARCKRPLAEATLQRVAKGMDRYVLKAKKPFLVSLTHQGGDLVESIDMPANTITGAHRGEKALVTPFITEHANATHQRNFSADEPSRTACAEVKGGHFALVSASLMTNTTGHTGSALNDPAPTVATGGHHTLVTGTLVQTGYGERPGQEPRAIDPEKPLGTVVAGGGKHAVAAASMVKLRGDAETHAPGSSLDEPGHTISAGGKHHGLVAASVIRHFGESVGQTVGAPAPTIVAGGGGKTGVVAAYLAQHNGGFNDTPGHPATEPISTIGGTGSQQQVVAASLAAYYGTEQDGQSVAEPARTVTTKDRLGLVESTGVTQMTTEQIIGALRVAAFLREYGVQFEGPYATIEGYVIVDIGMRMLTPRELFRAQGFGDNYIIDRAWVINPSTGDLTEVRLTKEQQIRMCGNSVCPQVEAALIRANVPELAAWSTEERRKRKVAIPK